jgi:hypothetical protein
MPVKIYGCPVEVPPPKYNFSDPWDKYKKDEAQHKKDLETFLREKLHFNGQNTGRIYQEQVADGYAVYMVAEAPKVFALIHLPYGDGYQSRDVQYLPKRVILERIEQREGWNTIFKKTPPKPSRKKT